MGLLRSLVIDAWSWLNYKPIYADTTGMPYRRAFPEAEAMWVPETDQRRLAAYKLLAAYDQNQAGELAAIRDGDTARDRREFGDPSMYIDTLMSHVLGDEQQITVPGADHDKDDTSPDTAMAERVQDLLRTWAEDELLPMRIQQAERKAVGLGDGVYRLAWDPAKQRPTARAMDPGFYFPILGEDDDAGDYPDRVHFAWELPADPRKNLKARLRRITYELDWIGVATSPGLDASGRPVRAPLPLPEAADDGEEPPGPLLAPGAFTTGDGRIARLYPWNDTASYVTCYLTDATWLMEDLRGPVDIDSLPIAQATFATRSDGEVLDHLDLQLDFLPVVHVPNTVPPAEEHWGQSSLAKLLQILDELAGTDTDSSAASATTGSPIIALSGAATAGKEFQMRPGTVLSVGEGGSMGVLNTAPQLLELRNRTKELQDRASNVARLPAVAMGTMDPAQIASGYALQLSLGPLDSLVASMRLARNHKYKLILKMVQRLYLAGQHPDWAGVTVQPAELVWGSYTPTDQQTILNQVVAGVDGGVLSLETGVRMLQEGGFPIEDIAKEIERIQSRQFDKAVQLANATNDTGAVGDFLGRKVEPDPTPPNPVFAGATQPPANPADDTNSTAGDGSTPQAQGSGGNAS